MKLHRTQHGQARSAKQGMVAMSILWIVALSSLSGCASDVRRTPAVLQMIAPNAEQERVKERSNTSVTRDSTAHDDPNGPANMLPYPFLDRVPGGAPQQLIKEATDIMDGSILQIWSVGRDLPSPPLRLFRVYTSMETGTFMELDGRYIWLSSRAELMGINQIVRRWVVKREILQNPSVMHDVLIQLMSFHKGNPRNEPASQELMIDMQSFLRGTQTSEAVFKEVCRDPETVFEGNKWTMKFNAFTTDGSVDGWRIIGRHDPATNLIEILRIDVTPVKPRGTFNWPLIG